MAAMHSDTSAVDDGQCSRIGSEVSGGDGGKGFMLFGVRVLTEGSFRKSVSMNNLAQYDQLPQDSNNDVAAGYASDDVVHPSGRSRERKRGVPWSEEEHRLFLLGLQKVGKGDWRGISRNYVKTRTPTQVASHAQKYFLRRNNHNRRRRRSSLFDITTDAISLAHNSELIERKGRILLSIKETPNGGNVTFDCSPSGPCIPCSRSEKKDKKYRCGETGYRIRLKCAPPGTGSKDSKGAKEQKERSTLELTESGVSQHGDLIISSTRQRRLLANSSKGGPRAYITYRSCIPAVNEEKLSVFGFETLMFGLLLSSGSFMYFRRKRAAVPGGVPVRLPTSSRF